VRGHAAMLLPPSRAAALSGRAREGVALIAGAMSSAGIAQRVVLSPLTVTTHAGRAMAKAGADRARLVVLAGQRGLAAFPARDDQITSRTCARQSSREKWPPG
jgi:DNA-binding CsgD family transcriptional regulator